MLSTGRGFLYIWCYHETVSLSFITGHFLKYRDMSGKRHNKDKVYHIFNQRLHLICALQNFCNKYIYNTDLYVFSIVPDLEKKRDMERKKNTENIRTFRTDKFCKNAGEIKLKREKMYVKTMYQNKARFQQ